MYLGSMIGSYGPKSKEDANLGDLGSLHYSLRVASAMRFIGHGAFGIITKKIWLNYFAVFGIGSVSGKYLNGSNAGQATARFLLYG